MTQVTLISKTQKAKSRIGNIKSCNPSWTGKWLILEQRNSVAFSDKEGPWFYVIPDTNNSKDFSRWVHHSDDTDFEVVKV